MDKVCVFMSTYNGEKFLRQQIDSIFNQKNIAVTLCIRDDGSTDRTVEIIKGYIEKGYSVDLEIGENVGFAKSFTLVSHKPIKADYYAFSDQDDVWLPEKLINAIHQLEKYSGPVLYGSNMRITDENLKGKGLWCENDFEYKRWEVQNCNALGYNMYGCTLVWNQEMQSLWVKVMPNYIVSQDVYMTTLAGALGKIVLDENVSILHRLHSSNTAGIERSVKKRIRKGYKLYFGKNRAQRILVAKTIIECYHKELQKTDNELIYKVANYKNSLLNKIDLLTWIVLSRLKAKKKIFLLLQICFNKL